MLQILCGLGLCSGQGGSRFTAFRDYQVKRLNYLSIEDRFVWIFSETSISRSQRRSASSLKYLTDGYIYGRAVGRKK